MNDNPPFKAHVMFCNSTGNNTVNMIPALQLGIKSVFIVSTEHTEKGLTQRLIDIMKNYNISTERITVGKDIEKNVIPLTDHLLKSTRHFKKIVWNITGGQKIPIIAFHKAFQKRIDDGFTDDVILYTEASPPAIWYLGSDYKTEYVRSDAALSLSDILHLYGSNIDADDRLYPEPSEEILKKLQTGRQALKYFMESEWFREIFFKSMKPNEAYTKKREEVEDLIKHSLNNVKPKLSEIGLTSIGYEKFPIELNSFMEKIIKNAINIDEARKIAEHSKILSKPSEIYNDYWNSIKRRVVEMVLENIEHRREKLLEGPVDDELKGRIISAIRSIGGEIEDFIENVIYKKDLKRLSSFRTGILFEWMIASCIIDTIQLNENIKNSIVSVHMGVKTKKAGDPSSKIDTDIDIAITTKFGTLLLLEMKTYEFSGDIVKSKESTAYKKSGPYGKALMVGPLLKSMIKEKENGDKVYPSYIDGKIKDAENTAKQNNVKYVYVDGITEMLKEELFCK